jgi:hypothetical protein
MRFVPAALSLLLIAAPAAAADKAKDAPPAVVQKLLDCRALTDATARLACLDAGVAALAGAVENRDVLVADREDVKKARRGLFGLTLPSFNLFGTDKEDADRGEKKDERGALTEIEATITSARPSRTAGWRMVLDDGSVWVQTDNASFRHDPRAGMKVRIRKAALGSYFANVDGQTAVRVKRVVE